MDKSMNTAWETSDSQVAVQPINPAAAVDAALRAIYFVYLSSEDLGLEFLDFANAIRENQEAKGQLEEVLCDAGTADAEDDARHAFGLGMVAGILYSASTGITLTVPPFSELKAVLLALIAQDKAQKAPDAQQPA
jgi:hypothetical protein